MSMRDRRYREKMFPSASGSIAASLASLLQRSVSRRASAVGSPFTYLSSQAAVYHAARSIPRSVAPKAGSGI
jgi:hypothetical protein